jgi:hypothetical protein
VVLLALEGNLTNTGFGFINQAFETFCSHTSQ